MNPQPVTLAKWLEKKYLEWMYLGGSIRTQKDFAEYLGVSQPVLNRYMTGRHKRPDFEIIVKFADKLGPEIYDVVGLDRPESVVRELKEAYEAVPEENQREFLDMIEKYLLANGWKRVK